MLFISAYHLVNIRWLWWKAKLILVTCVILMEKVTTFLLVWNWSWLSCFYIHVCSIIMWNILYFSKVNVSFNTELQNNMFSGLSFYEILQFKKPYLLIFPKVTEEDYIPLILEVKVVQKLWIVCHLFMPVLVIST